MHRTFALILVLGCAPKPQLPTLDSLLVDVGSEAAPAPATDEVTSMSSNEPDPNACMLDEQWGQPLWNVGVSAFMRRNSARQEDRDFHTGSEPWDPSRWDATRMNGNVEEFVMIAGNLDFFPENALDWRQPEEGASALDRELERSPELASASQLKNGSGVRLELQYPRDFDAYAIFLAMNGREIAGVRVLPRGNHASEYAPPGTQVSCAQARAWAVRVLEASAPYVHDFHL